jgi:hypothetical protein
VLVAVAVLGQWEVMEVVLHQEQEVLVSNHQ